MRPDVVVECLERSAGVERDGLCAPADVGVAVLDAEEELGTESYGGATGGGELAQDGCDSGFLVVVVGIGQRNNAFAALGKQGWRVVTRQELDGGGIRVAIGSEAARVREEWRCLLVAHLKVCSIAERGAGGGRTSSGC